MSIESLSRTPDSKYSEHNEMFFGGMLRSLNASNGQFSTTTQTFTWTENVSW